MKKVIVISFMMLLLPAWASAQSGSFRDLYNKYAGAEGYVTVEMSGSMFNVINGAAEENNGTRAEFMNKIDNLVIIVADAPDPVFGRDVEAMVGLGGYKPMTTIRDGGDKVDFYMIRHGDTTSEFMMTVAGESEFVVMSITGKGLTVDEISQIVQKTTAP